jgi:hypothetical protein
MADPKELAQKARSTLAQALDALQGAQDVPEELLEVAEPIAEVMGLLHRIEKGSTADPALCKLSLDRTRGALDMLQSFDAAIPAVEAAMEAVAGSLSKLFALSRAVEGGAKAPASIPRPAQAAPRAQPAPQPAAQPAPQPAAQPAPQPAAQPAPQAAWPASPAGLAPQPQPQQPQPQPQAAWPAQPPVQAPAQPTVPLAQQGFGPQPGAQAPYFPPQQQGPQGYGQGFGPQGAGPQGFGPQPAAPAGPQGFGPQPVPAEPAVPFGLQPTAQQPAPWPAPQQGPTQGFATTQPAADANLGQTVALQEPAGGGDHVPGTTGMPPPPADARLVEVELGAHSSSNFYKGLSGNDVIDHGGIFVATYQIPKVGTPVALKMLLPGDLEFLADAVVQWTRETRGGESDPGFGAKITRISPEGRQLVYRYVRNREPMFYDDM